MQLSLRKRRVNMGAFKRRNNKQTNKQTKKPLGVELGKESAANRARSFIMKRPRISRMQITVNDSQSREFSGISCFLRKSIAI